MLSLQDKIKVNSCVLTFFRLQLELCKSAKEYTLSRISQDAINTFYVGYAPRDHTILQMLADHGLSLQDSDDLCITKDGKPFFYDRIMWPIIHAGCVVGFAGRTMHDGPAKFLNSTNSSIFTKTSNLFGLHQNRESILENKYAILTEGYFDVIGLWDHGVTNALATCGTTLSKDHVSILKRYTKNIILCFDGDTAGKKATNAALSHLQNKGFKVSIIELPSGKDPDEYIAEHGKDKFLSLAKKGE